MDLTAYKIIDNKVIIRTRGRICEKPDELLNSPLFRKILNQCITKLQKKSSPLLNVFSQPNITPGDVQLLIETLIYLLRVPPHLVTRLIAGSDQFFSDKLLLNAFIEYLYNYWRDLERLIICDSEGQDFDISPYRTFDNTIEKLTHLIRSTYRDLQESISGIHPRIYRQVSAGAEIAAIALPKPMPYLSGNFQKLSSIPIIRQILIYPPLIFNPAMNKRTGSFERVTHNPLDYLDLGDTDEWLCYPARVGDLIILVYFHLAYFELGFSLCNLFEVADDKDLIQQPDAIYIYGAPEGPWTRSPGGNATIFYTDEESGILCATVPNAPQYAYFGYLKKMILTLHNIKMMEKGRLPFHGALVNLKLQGHGSYNVLLIGDSGAGKSETIETLRGMGSDEIQDLTIVADDMGSVDIAADGSVLGYGTEIGAFVRLDDLQPGFAFGQMDRAIFLNANQVNARVVLPVTTFDNVICGWKIDFVLYANNYEAVDDAHPAIERFNSAEDALPVFRAGAVMSKGTTTTTGLVGNYFANIFGPVQHQEMHDALAKRYFAAFFDAGVYVGQLRTQLGINGMEMTGPEISAQALLDLLRGSEPKTA